MMQLAYKITSNTAKMGALRLAIGESKLNDTISKWYMESTITEYFSPQRNNESLAWKIEQNRIARQKSLEASHNFIVK